MVRDYIYVCVAALAWLALAVLKQKIYLTLFLRGTSLLALRSSISFSVFLQPHSKSKRLHTHTHTCPYEKDARNLPLGQSQ
jgi:hypothetical protein